MAANFKRLLSPFQINGVTLKNRTVKMASAMGLATSDGFVTDDNIAFYETIAKGGVGLIIVEQGFIDYPMGVSGPNRIGISDDKYLPGMTRLAEAVHKYDVRCFQQLGHSGPSQKYLLAPGQKPVASSYTDEAGPRPLSVAEIEQLVEKWAQAAARAQQAGYDGVEVQSASIYLLNSFLSLTRNKRDDAYGNQTLQSRTKFLVDVLHAIRAKVGRDYAIGVRFNFVEYGIENGTTIEEGKAFAKIIEEAGADYITTQVRGFGPYDMFPYPEQIQYPEPMAPLAKKIRKVKYHVPLITEIKKQVKIPVVAIGRLDANLGEWILQHGVADLIAFNRRLFADPEYLNKVAAGRFDDIAPCTACMHCWASQQTGGHIECRINAALGRERELFIKPAGHKKKVLIVGGGPAGLEAARVSALRGHEVTLYDKGNALGGLIPLAAMIKGTEIEELPVFVAYFKTQLHKLGVQVRLNTEVTPSLIDQVKPDVILIATGATLTRPEIPGIDKRIVVSNAVLHRISKRFMKYFGPDLMRWLTNFYMPFGKRVVIIGGLMQGCELADFLIKRERTVTLVEATDQIGTGIHEINRRRLIPWLTQKGVVMLTGVTYKAAVDTGLMVITKEGEEKTLEADSVLIATPPVANPELYNMLKGKAKEVYQIGDSREPGMIIDAVSEGLRIARMI